MDPANERNTGFLAGLHLKLAGRKSTRASHLAFLWLVAFPVVIFIIPYFVGLASSLLDGVYPLPRPDYWLVNRLGAVIFMLYGLMVGNWAVYTLYREGQGTPNPALPTRKLVTGGPFASCRNPLSPSVGFYVGGLCLWNQAVWGLILVAVLITALMVFVKLVEERELEIRFGAGYMEYKGKTPFFAPVNILRPVIDFFRTGD